MSDDVMSTEAEALLGDFVATDEGTGVVDQRDIVFGDEPEKVKSELLDWLLDELSDLRPSTSGAANDRAQMELDWQEWRRMSLARPESREKNTPWPKASNVSTPFMFSNINGVTSHVKSALSEKKPRARINCLNEQYKTHAYALEEWLNRLLESPLHINMPKHDEVIHYETARMGTQVVETAWEEDRIQLKRDVNGQAEVVDKTIYAGPRLTTYRLEDVFVRNEFEDPQKTPVIFLRRYYSRQDLQRLEYDGFFTDVDAVLGNEVVQQSDGTVSEKVTMGLNPNMGSSPSPSQLYEVLKTYVRFDADNDGAIEDLIVWWNPESRVILRAEFNELGTRPVRNPKHISIPGQFYGVGVGHMLAPLQAEIDTLHNMRVDSIHISSLQLIKSRKGSAVLGPNDPLYPLKNIEVDDMSDIDVMRFPNAAQETMMAEKLAEQYGRTVTGISESQLGMPDTVAKSGTSPTLQQFLSEQGNRVLRAIIKNAERAQGEIVMDCLLQLVANSARVVQDGSLLSVAEPTHRVLIEEVLTMSVEDIPLTFQFIVRSTEVDETQDAKRQMILTKTQLYTQYFQMAMQIQSMMMQVPPEAQEMKEFLTQMFVGFTKLTEETLKLYDVDNTDELLPMVDHTSLMLQLMEQMKKPMVEQLEGQLRRMRNDETGNAGTDMGAYGPTVAGALESDGGAGMGQPGGMAGGPAQGPTVPSQGGGY